MTDKNKGHAYNPNRYRGKEMWTKTQGPELEANKNFNGQRSDLEGYISDLGPRASDKLTRTMKELEQYFGATCRDSFQTAIINKTPATLPDTEMPPIIPEMGV